MTQVAIHAGELEGLEAEVVEARHFAGEEIPAVTIGLEEFRIAVEYFGGVVHGVHGEAYQLDGGRGRGGVLDAAHLVAHHGAWAFARSVDEVGDPDVAVEGLAVEG